MFVDWELFKPLESIRFPDINGFEDLFELGIEHFETTSTFNHSILAISCLLVEQVLHFNLVVVHNHFDISIWDILTQISQQLVRYNKVKVLVVCIIVLNCGNFISVQNLLERKHIFEIFKCYFSSFNDINIFELLAKIKP